MTMDSFDEDKAKTNKIVLSAARTHTVLLLVVILGAFYWGFTIGRDW